jgi:hypothetical protein
VGAVCWVVGSVVCALEGSVVGAVCWVVGSVVGGVVGSVVCALEGSEVESVLIICCPDSSSFPFLLFPPSSSLRVSLAEDEEVGTIATLALRLVPRALRSPVCVSGVVCFACASGVVCGVCVSSVAWGGCLACLCFIHFFRLPTVLCNTVCVCVRYVCDIV